MPKVDIRSFFGGKPTLGTVPKPKKEEAVLPKKRGRGHKRVVEDSDDDEFEPVKRTPQKKPPPTRAKEESKEETITTSAYFASSGKSKPQRFTSVRIRTGDNVKESKKPTTKAESQDDSVKPKTSNKRASTLSKSAKTTLAEDDEKVDVLGDEQPSKKTDAPVKDEDDEDDEDDVIMPPMRKRNGTASSKAERNSILKVEEDADMKDVTADDDFVPDEDEVIDTKPAQRSKAGRKRKSNYRDSDEDEDPTPKKVRSSKSSSAIGSSQKRASNGARHESKELQDIFDNIPIVRPPSPPSQITPQKFKFGQHLDRAPAAAGTKEMPVGAENCLAGLTFVFTGVLETLERDKGQELVKRYGGKVTTAPSSKTSYVVLGDDAGPRKLKIIKQHHLKTINEDGLFELIKRLPANGGSGAAAEKNKEKLRQEEEKVRKMAEEIDKVEARQGNAGGIAHGPLPGKTSTKQPAVESRLWTTKYAPTSMNMICGNKTQVEKLQKWLHSWRDSANHNFKKAGYDGTGAFRSMMIHGPPGIGKTTAAHLVAKLEGYDVVENNASDTRNKKLLETSLQGVLDTTSLMGYFSGDGKEVQSGKKNLVLIMDEVDGMSAGDRGGVGALALIAKKTNVPVILICNDRKQPKMKPFDGICYDLPFRRPTVEQIRGRMKTICFREGLKIDNPVLDALIEGTHADIRQIVNMLSTAKLDQSTMSYDQSKAMSKAWQKHIILKPWDIVNTILGSHMFAPNSTKSLNDKTELYFNDHELSPLMLQENYLKTQPALAQGSQGKLRRLKTLELLDQAAESISDGDLVDRMIHGPQQHWTLMNEHSIFSFVRPASFVYGSLAGGGPTQFTMWLGQNSKLGRLSRCVKEIQGHMRLRANADRHEIRQQYLPVLWLELAQKLQRQGPDYVPTAIKLMDSYYLTRDDYDAIVELGVGPMAEGKAKIETKTKSTFTRIYNQQSHPMPFMKASSVSTSRKLGKERPDLEEAILESEEEETTDMKGDEDEELDLKKDKYVKVPKHKSAPKKKANGKKAAQKRKAKNDYDDEDISSEDVKPKRARGRAKAAGRK